MTGRFAFSQPCVQYDVDTNKQQATTNYTGAGGVTYSSSSGQIIYAASIGTTAGGAIQLTLQGVNVTGAQNTQVSLDGSSDDLLSKILSYIWKPTRRRPYREQSRTSSPRRSSRRK